MNMHVHTAEGIATICGDVIYDINDQIVEPFREIHDGEPRTTGNHGTSKRAEKAAIKKLLSQLALLLPVHDRPAKIEGGVVVGRLQDQVPGPIVQSLPQTQLVPGLTERRSHDPFGAASEFEQLIDVYAPVGQARHRVHLHRGADLAPGRASSHCSRTCRPTCAGAGTSAAASSRSGAVEQMQRHDL
jgi:hypothetical protein